MYAAAMLKCINDFWKESISLKWTWSDKNVSDDTENNKVENENECEEWEVSGGER